MRESENKKLTTTISELNQALCKANLEKSHFEDENKRIAKRIEDLDSLKRENEILRKGQVKD